MRCATSGTEWSSTGSFSYGTLKVGEVVVPGQSEESIILWAHLRALLAARS
jgi:hypothetical protein